MEIWYDSGMPNTRKIGETKANNFDEIMEIVNKFCDEHNWKAPYVRTWAEETGRKKEERDVNDYQHGRYMYGDVLYLDIGSHSEFIVAFPYYMN